MTSKAGWIFMDEKNTDQQTDNMRTGFNRGLYYFILVFSTISITAAEFISLAHHIVWGWEPKFAGLYFLVVLMEICMGVSLAKDRKLSLCVTSIIIAVLIPILTIMVCAIIIFNT